MAKNIVTDIDGLYEAINGVLDDYNENVTDGVKKETRRAMKDLVQNTKSTAPVGHRSKHYRDSISSKKITDNLVALIMLWYVRGSDYRLSHLLNNGHALRDGGRYPGTNFIGNAVNVIIPFYVKSIKEVLKRG